MTFPITKFENCIDKVDVVTFLKVFKETLKMLEDGDIKGKRDYVEESTCFFWLLPFWTYKAVVRKFLFQNSLLLIDKKFYTVIVKLH
jgi:hypothetical protein